MCRGSSPFCLPLKSPRSIRDLYITERRDDPFFLFVSYLVGLITVRLSAWGFEKRRGEGPRTYAHRVVTVGRCGSELVASEYARLVRDVELLQGSCSAIAVLVLGLLLKIPHIAPDIGGHLLWGRLVFVGVGLSLLVVVVVAWSLAKRTHTRIQALVDEVDPPTR